MADDRGEVVMVDPEAVMGLVERATVVPVRAAEHLRHQEHLVALESRDVDPFEVRRKLRVAENPLVEVVYDSAHGRPAADGVVVADRTASRLVTHGVLSFHPEEATPPFP